MTSVLREILEWSNDRPPWQRDALRRLVTGAEIGVAALDELTELCKLRYGLAANVKARYLGKDDIAPEETAAIAVTLESVTHNAGVNALAPNQTVHFGPRLTVVFGRNAAGKSGYTRILKSACRSRGPEKILGNVLSVEAPLAARATIAFRRGDEAKSHVWTRDSIPADDLAVISVFDAQSATVYLKDKTDVAFRPFGLDIFDKLSTICGEVRARLELEQRQIEAELANLPKVPDGTQVKTLLDGLTGLTDVDHVRRLASLSKEEQARLKQLCGQLQDLQASNPKVRGQELNLKAGRLDAVVQHLERIIDAVNPATLASLEAADDKLGAARQSLEALRQAAFPENLLKGTGGQEWLRMWEAAQSFSATAYPDVSFPVTAHADCVLCQQTIGTDAVERFAHFAEYVASATQAAVQNAEGDKVRSRDRILSPDAERQDVMQSLDELAADTPELATSVREYLLGTAEIQRKVKDFASTQGGAIAPPPSQPRVDEMRGIVTELHARASVLLREEPVLDEKESVELKDLEARALLAGSQQIVIGEIERKRRISAYRECIDDTATNLITRKSTELTKALVSDQLRETFRREATQIEFTELGVEIQPAGGARGALYHKIVFATAPNVNVAEVLSEGESRALALAAFMTELSTSEVQSAIVFDDPVSSLDHIWRERIAKRLVTEAQTRQVIVFTHDIVFLRALLDSADREGVACTHQYVRREDGPGVSSPELPWVAMRIRERIGVLRNNWQASDKLFRDGRREAYEDAARKIYGQLREAWEQAVGEILLNDVVERFRVSVQTQRVAVLYDIDRNDCSVVEESMTECSRWVHDQAAADGTPIPAPAQLAKQIDALDGWVQTIRRRRN